MKKDNKIYHRNFQDSFQNEDKFEFMQNMASLHDQFQNSRDQKLINGFSGDLSLQFSSSSLNMLDKRNLMNISQNIQKRNSILESNLIQTREQNDSVVISDYKDQQISHILDKKKNIFNKSSRSIEGSQNQKSDNYKSINNEKQTKDQSQEKNLTYSKSLSDKNISRKEQRSKSDKYKNIITFLSYKGYSNSNLDTPLKDNQKNSDEIKRDVKIDNQDIQIKEQEEITQEEEEYDEKHNNDVQIASKTQLRVSGMSQKSPFPKKTKDDLKGKKKLGNFDKGIQIIQNIFKNQLNKTMKIKRKAKQFIKLLLMQTPKRKIRDLSQNNYEMIGDVSYYQINISKYEQRKSIFQNDKKNGKTSNKLQYSPTMYGSLSKLTQKQNILLKILSYVLLQIASLMKRNICKRILPLFMPTDLLLVIWDAIQLIITYTFLYIYSIHAFFGQNSEKSFLGIYLYIIFFIVVIDIVVKFNTAFYEKDAIIKKHSKIVEKNVFSYKFWIDIMNLFIIMFKLKSQTIYGITFNPDHDLKIYLLNCLLFFLAIRLSEKRKRFDDLITLEESAKHIYRLFCQVINLVMVAHVAAIGLYLLYLFEESKGLQINWISTNKLQSNTYYEKYIYSVYWSITTMTTEAYKNDYNLIIKLDMEILEQITQLKLYIYQLL